MSFSRDLRIIYMGTPDFAVEPLKALLDDGYNVVAVITAPDKPAGRGLKLHESAVKNFAIEKGLNIFQPEKLRDQSFLNQIEALKPDLGIVIAFRMLPEILWSMPKYGTFNLHASLLPQYRGAAPINWAVINGEEYTGVTTFMLNSEIDKGDIILQKRVGIDYGDNAGTLHDKLMNVGAKVVPETVDVIFSGKYDPVMQDNDSSELKPAPKIFKADCRINWNGSAENIRNHIRGLSPYPGAWTEMSTGEENVQFKIFAVDSEIVRNTDRNPGEILSDGKKELKVACGNGYVYIKELQPSGKKRMLVEEFLRGFKNINECSFN
ncbi:MAG: methionyl-tRNA formyltransferase [Rikenellaceae bacterium]|nr:methionyl-tRNA formyltransferase [Rikenellaceae bacterium]